MKICNLEGPDKILLEIFKVFTPKCQHGIFQNLWNNLYYQLANMLFCFSRGWKKVAIRSNCVGRLHIAAITWSVGILVLIVVRGQIDNYTLSSVCSFSGWEAANRRSLTFVCFAICDSISGIEFCSAVARKNGCYTASAKGLAEIINLLFDV